jgi:hypothetical protein
MPFMRKDYITNQRSTRYQAPKNPISEAVQDIELGIDSGQDGEGPCQSKKGD